MIVKNYLLCGYKQSALSLYQVTIMHHCVTVYLPMWVLAQAWYMTIESCHLYFAASLIIIIIIIDLSTLGITYYYCSYI